MKRCTHKPLNKKVVYFNPSTMRLFHFNPFVKKISYIALKDYYVRNHILQGNIVRQSFSFRFLCIK